MTVKEFAQGATQQFLQILDPESLFKKRVWCQSGKKNELIVGSECFKLEDFDQLMLVGIGKAGSAHVDVVQRHLDGILSIPLVSAAISKRGHLVKSDQIIQFESDHPIPSEEGLVASRKFAQFLTENSTEKSLVLFFISGGGSALLEILKEDVSLADLSRLTQEGLSDGSSIHDLNLRRKELSQVKDGGLLNFLKLQRGIAMYTSDVPGNKIESIASSPLIGKKAPAELAGRLEHEIVLSAEIVLQDWMAQLQLPQARYVRSLDCTAEEMLSKTLTDLSKSPNSLCLYGGEAVVEIPPDVSSGRGGRNTHAVALLAQSIFSASHSDLDWVNFVYSLASDGGDGPFDFAGAWLTRELYEQGRAEGLHIEEFIKNYDTATYFEKLDTLIKTGPTGSNVMDLRMVGRWSV